MYNTEGEHMKYVIQTINGNLRGIEEIQLKNILDGRVRFMGYEYKLSERADIDGLDNYIPVGNIGFIGQHLKKYYNIDKQNPIEIPKALRKEEYLGRYYRILRKQDLPDRGFSFIKNESELKSFCGLMAINRDTLKSIEDGIYQVAEYTEFVSEYRVFVLDGEIEAIQHYREDVKVFPDVATIENIISDYMKLDGSSRAFTVDIGIDKGGRTRLIEMHTFTSCGTYGYEDESLLHMYKYGYEYWVHSNKEIELDEL